MVLAIVLGDKAEEAFRQSLLASQGSLGVFFSNGLVGTIMMLGLIALFWPLIQELWTACGAPAPADLSGGRSGLQNCHRLQICTDCAVANDLWNIVYQP